MVIIYITVCAIVPIQMVTIAHINSNYHLNGNIVVLWVNIVVPQMNIVVPQINFIKRCKPHIDLDIGGF